MKLFNYSLFLLYVAFFLYGCNANKKNNTEGDVDSTLTSVEATSGDNEESIDKQEIINFITEMYNNRDFEDSDFLEKHCSPEMLKKLQDDCEYEGGGYASWDFRSGEQDGPSEKHEIISVEPQGDDWYKYEFYDMGVKESHLIKVVAKEGTLKIEDLK